ncbi:MAG: hypothetical protein WBA57_22160 [Elainellaceae cyanobacterium]
MPSATRSDDTLNAEHVDNGTSRQDTSFALTEEASGDRPATTPSRETPASVDELARKLPYRPSQQVEFLNLQVEMEALLHQIHLRQRQRQLATTLR